MKTPSLIDILKEPTEQKIIGAVFDAVQEERPEPNLDDFAQETQEDAPQETQEDAPQKTPTEAPPQEPIKKEITLEDATNTASMVVASYDALQTLTFPFLYQRALFTKEERQTLKNIKVKMRQSGVASLDEHEQILFDKYTTYSDIKDSVSFTEDETQLIIQPLAEVFKKYNISLGPEMLLLGALATVSLPRFLPFFTPLEKL